MHDDEYLQLGAHFTGEYKKVFAWFPVWINHKVYWMTHVYRAPHYLYGGWAYKTEKQYIFDALKTE